jgi:phage-related protein
MAGNQTTLTIAGDASTLQTAARQADNALESTERQMDQVGQAARQMNTSIGSSEDAMVTAGRNAGRLGEGLDRASGASSMLAGGLGDVGGALTEAFGEEHPIGKFGAQMESAGTLVMGLTGALDLMILANMAAQASWVRTAASMAAARVSMIATSIATGVATAAQWLWNVAMTANPIGLIIVGIAALVAGIVWLATQTDFFGKAWEVIWGGVKGYFDWVVGNYKAAIGAMAAAGSWLLEQIRKIPTMIGAYFSGLFNIITFPFRTAFNAVARMWNSTIGRLSWTVPSWVPIIGGNTFSAPRLPTLHSGGRVPGRPGDEVMAILKAGETVGAESAAGGGGQSTIVIRSGGSRFDDLLVEFLAGAIERRGGIAAVFPNG